MFIGNTSMWADTFPDELVPRILDLITETWEGLEKPGDSDHEVAITKKFKHFLKQAKNYRKLPVRIERESPEDDSNTGEELGRIDLKFMPATSAVEEVYLAFECKRLHVVENGKLRSLASEYVKEGMLRFVNGQYASTLRHGGMIGYVLNGNCVRAIQQIERNLTKLHDQLRLSSGALAQSSLRSENTNIRETSHRLEDSRTFRIHHLFLGCTDAVTVAGASAAPNN